MWEQVTSATVNISYDLIIPTRVGTRLADKSTVKSESNHPHACGDKSTSSLTSMAYIKSSPRVWGQDRRKTWIDGQHWIIPTRVGTRHYPANLSKTAGDHPHACGDKTSCVFSPLDVTGSSPRVWGQAACDLLHYAYAGIIPTRVGTSAVCRSYFTSREDHPHACGDKSLTSSQRQSLPGSSPRVWGQEPPIIRLTL